MNQTNKKSPKNPLPNQPVRMNPITSFELLFFAVFGQTTTEQTQVDKTNGNTTRTQPFWTEYLFKIVFGIYMLVSVVVLINLLIAMMSDTYQRIQVFECFPSQPQIFPAASVSPCRCTLTCSSRLFRLNPTSSGSLVCRS